MARRWRSTSRLLEEELAYRGEDRRAPDWHKDEHRPRRRLRGADHRRRDVRAAGRPSAAAGGRGLHDRREGRRRRRHVAREHLPRLSGRQSEPQLQLLVRAAPRLAVPLLAATRVARVLPALCRRVRSTRRRSSSDRGHERSLGGRHLSLDGHHAAMARATSGRSRCTRSSAPSASSTDRCYPTSKVVTPSRATRSTRRVGTTTWTWPASGWP